MNHRLEEHRIDAYYVMSAFKIWKVCHVLIFPAALSLLPQLVYHLRQHLKGCPVIIVASCTNLGCSMTELWPCGTSGQRIHPEMKDFTSRDEGNHQFFILLRYICSVSICGSCVPCCACCAWQGYIKIVQPVREGGEGLEHKECELLPS